VSDNAPIDSPTGVAPGAQSLTAAINPTISAEQQMLLVETIQAARTKYPHFLVLEPLMATIGAALLLPNWEKVRVDEYVSSLYAIAIHADFCSDVRDKLLQDAAAVNQSESATAEKERLFTAAMASVRERYPLVDFYFPVMERIAGGLTRNARELTAAGYVEALFLAAKEAAFAEPLRAQLLQGAVPEGGR
jgi:hypothetical protein